GLPSPIHKVNHQIRSLRMCWTTIPIGQCVGATGKASCSGDSGASLHRDHNAARNIERAGQALRGAVA
ncbi:MAG: hypothetical protein ACHQ4H_05370, partial [Ktedonobacterales bacterium]